MRPSLTSAIPTVPRARRGATRRSQAASPGALAGRPDASDTTTRSRVSGSGIPAGEVRVRLVRLDDLLHQLVADDVAIIEVDERDAVDRADDFHRLDEPAGAAGWQIDLRDVAGDHRLGAEAEPRQEHLHLLGGRVLRLVEDDERV